MNYLMSLLGFTSRVNAAQDRIVLALEALASDWEEVARRNRELLGLNAETPALPEPEKKSRKK